MLHSEGGAPGAPPSTFSYRSIFRRSGRRFVAENATQQESRALPTKWAPVRREKCNQTTSYSADPFHQGKSPLSNRRCRFHPGTEGVRCPAILMSAIAVRSTTTVLSKARDQPDARPPHRPAHVHPPQRAAVYCGGGGDVRSRTVPGCSIFPSWDCHSLQSARRPARSCAAGNSNINGWANSISIFMPMRTASLHARTWVKAKPSGRQSARSMTCLQHILLWPNNRIGWMIPKRAFDTPQEAADFAALAKEKTDGQTL